MVPGATAFQISDVPSRVLARRTSVHCRPPPLTAVVWPPLREPSDDTKASSTSPVFSVENAGVVCGPLPSTLAVPSTARAPDPPPPGGGGGGGGGGGAPLATVTAATSDVLARP